MSKILNLSESTLIALHSLALIAKAGTEKVNSKTIASKTGASENTISKVMQRLVKEQILHSDRGPAGGFTLLKPPGNVSFIDIFEAIEGKVDIDSCPFGNDKCMFEECMFDGHIKKISADFYRFLENKTLVEFI